MKRAVILCLAVAVGCREQQSVTAPKPPSISAAILDGAHENGNPHFFFLPPMVGQPSFSGTFNPNLGPVVQICTLKATTTGTACDPTITPINPGPVQVANQQYQVNWNTATTNVSTSSTYRIQVFAANLLLGLADVQPISNGSVKNRVTGDTIALVDGRTLPIKFRIESGALCFGSTECGEGTAGPAGATIVSQNQDAGVLVPAGALANTVTLLVSQSSTGPCLPLNLLQSGTCFNFVTSPPGQFLTNVTVAICVDLDAFGTIPTSHRPWFVLHRLDVVANQPVVTPLPNASAAFLPCNGKETVGPPAIGMSGVDRWLALAKAGAHHLVEFFTPRKAYAFHLGVGGSTCCFSQIGWALPAIMTKNAGDLQTAVSGTAVPTRPAVVLRDSGGAPIQGETVTFAVGSGGGSVTGATQVTDANGVATVGSWTLGTTDGPNTLIATSNGAVGSPQTFTATGVTITAQVTEAIGDATTDSRIAISPDLDTAQAIAGGGNLKLTVLLGEILGEVGSVSTFDPATTHIFVDLDVDQNPNTGAPGVDAAGNDATIFGTDYLVEMGSASEGSSARVLHFADGSFSLVGTFPVTQLNNLDGSPEGLQVTIPLSALGNDDGQMNFKVLVQSQLTATPSYTGVLDYMPNLGLAPGSLNLPGPPIL